MAGPKPLSTRREFFADRAQAAEAGDRASTARALNKCPFLIGRMISVNLVAGTPKTIRHALGVPAAFFVARANYDGTGTAATVTESVATVQAKLNLSSQLSVVSAVSCKVDLWFYPRGSAVIVASTGQSV